MRSEGTSITTKINKQSLTTNKLNINDDKMSNINAGKLGNEMDVEHSDGWSSDGDPPIL